MRPPIQVRAIPPDEKVALEKLYRQTSDVRMRERLQIILLASEQGMLVPAISRIVRRSEEVVRIWIKRFNAEGIAGLSDKPRPGAPRRVTAAYREQLVECVRQRPRALGQSYSMWTLQRLADYMAEQTAIRVSAVTVRSILAENEIVLSRPQHKVTSPDPAYQVKKRRLQANATT